MNASGNRPRRNGIRVAAVIGAAILCVGWNETTVRHVAWTAVDFFPPDLARQVKRHHRRFDAGIRRGLSAPPSWRAGPPGNLRSALESQVEVCAQSLRRPVPLADLVEEIGFLAVLVADANDPLAVVHDDPQESQYAAAYAAYAASISDRLHLVYYGQDEHLISEGAVIPVVDAALARSGALYPFVGQEFYRTGELRDWRGFDDRSVAFGVAAVSLSRALTDLANFTAFVWRQGGGAVPTPIPTPTGHVGPTITRTLSGGFPDRDWRDRGTPVIPSSRISLPPP